MEYVEAVMDLTEWGVPLGYRAVVVSDDEPTGITTTYGSVVIKNAVGHYVLLEQDQFRYLSDEDFEKEYSPRMQFLIGLIIIALVYIGDRFTT